MEKVKTLTLTAGLRYWSTGYHSELQTWQEMSRRLKKRIVLHLGTECTKQSKINRVKGESSLAAISGQTKAFTIEQQQRQQQSLLTHTSTNGNGKESHH